MLPLYLMLIKKVVLFFDCNRSATEIRRSSTIWLNSLLYKFEKDTDRNRNDTGKEATFSQKLLTAAKYVRSLLSFSLTKT